MKKETNKENGSSESTSQQAKTPIHQAIYLGADLDKKSIVVSRIIDHSTAQAGQRLSWQGFEQFVQKQRQLARQVYVVYEAGAFGFWLARKLRQMGVECFVVHPEKLDPRSKRVQTDKLDARHLAEKLQRYVLGNKRAMVPVRIPSEAEERKRLESRHREALARQMRSLEARGNGLLLSQGIFDVRGWWKDKVWEELKPRLSPELAAVLEDDRELIKGFHERIKVVDKKVVSSAPKSLPVGFGALTFELLRRELGSFDRFANRRGVAGFMGLCGAVSSSGDYHIDMSINKAGSPLLRRLLIELAWRMILWQPNYTGLRVWKLAMRQGGGKRRLKKAVVAVARQLAVDIWRWQTGRATAEQLGWKMSCSG